MKSAIGSPCPPNDHWVFRAMLLFGLSSSIPFWFLAQAVTSIPACSTTSRTGFSFFGRICSAMLSIKARSSVVVAQFIGHTLNPFHGPPSHATNQTGTGSGTSRRPYVP